MPITTLWENASVDRERRELEVQRRSARDARVGRHVVRDVDRIGGVPVVLKHLLDEGLLHGDCMTITGRTMAEGWSASM